MQKCYDAHRGEGGIIYDMMLNSFIERTRSVDNELVHIVPGLIFSVFLTFSEK